MYKDLRDQNDVFAGMFCQYPAAFQITHSGGNERVNGDLVSGSFFPVLGVKPAIGRLLTAGDEAVGAHAVAVLSYGYWKVRFDGDPAVLGRTVAVNGHPFEIVGVAPSGFNGLDVGQPPQV